jgi:hypothetical protein
MAGQQLTGSPVEALGCSGVKTHQCQTWP